MNSQFLLDRIKKTKELIVAYEDAVLALTTGGIHSYTLNTSQSTQTVTKQNLNETNAALEGLYARLAVLEARAYGTGSMIGVPAN